LERRRPPTAHRAHFRPDDARHGYRWAYGALRHRTGDGAGAVFVQTAATRDTASWLRFLDGLEAFFPAGDGYLIVDGLPLHWTMDTMLTMRWNWGHPRFHFVPLPKNAAWLNLIEGFWKILRQRALAGRALAGRVCVSTQDQHRGGGSDDARRGGRLEPASHPLPLGTATQTNASVQAHVCLSYLRNDALS
jgi:hypothetical protein